MEAEGPPAEEETGGPAEGGAGSAEGSWPEMGAAPRFGPALGVAVMVFVDASHCDGVAVMVFVDAFGRRVS